MTRFAIMKRLKNPIIKVYFLTVITSLKSMHCCSYIGLGILCWSALMFLKPWSPVQCKLGISGTYNMLLIIWGNGGDGGAWIINKHR